MLRYIRKGQCNRCGICCLTEDCEYLEMNKIATCKIYNDNERQDKCKTFPQAPPITIDECGYYFLDTWENNRIVRVREV